MVEVYVWELPPSCSECFACRQDAYGNDECGISGELLEDPPFCVDNFSWHDKWNKRRPDCPLKLKKKPGHWIKMSDAYGVYWACSECGEDLPRVNHFDPQFDLFPRLESIDRTNYCPNCGAPMEVSEE